VTGLVAAAPPDEPTVHVSAVPGMDEPDTESPRRRWFLPAAIALLVLAVIAGSMMIVFGPPSDPTAGPASPSPTVAPSTSAPPPAPLLLADDLDKDRLWLAKTEPDGRSSCVFTGGELHVRIDAKPLYKCRGPQDTLPEDLSIEVGVRLVSEGACAAVWFHFKLPRGGHLVRICQDNIFVGTHQSSDVSVSRTLPLDNPIAVGGPSARISLRVLGDMVTVSRDGVPLGDAPLGRAEISGNRVLLGVFLDRGTPDSGGGEVAFDHIEVRGPTAAGPR
jgi:hypothetical protein